MNNFMNLASTVLFYIAGKQENFLEKIWSCAVLQQISFTASIFKTAVLLLTYKHGQIYLNARSDSSLESRLVLSPPLRNKFPALKEMKEGV